MAARAVASATISFGLVNIPVKLFTAATSEQVRFNMLNPETGSRVKQQYYDPTNGKIVSRSELVKGYEYTKGQYVVFEEEELKKLEAEKSSSLDIVEFVPLASVDLIHVEKSYYLGADKGGDKAYRLLSQAMTHTGKVAIGRWSARGKEQLILIRPYKRGLILHQLYYANEVRSFEDIDPAAEIEISEAEEQLAERLIDELAKPEFGVDKYQDEYATRVLAAVDEKVAGKEITIMPEQPKAQIIDLFEALKKSLSEAQAASGEEATGENEAGAKEGKPRPVKKAVPRRQAKKKKAV